MLEAGMRFAYKDVPGEWSMEYLLFALAKRR
jgi:hypothetical protein